MIIIIVLIDLSHLKPLPLAATFINE